MKGGRWVEGVYDMQQRVLAVFELGLLSLVSGAHSSNRGTGVRAEVRQFLFGASEVEAGAAQK